MRYVTSIICCLAFAIAGILLAIHDNNVKELALTKHQTLNAATLPVIRPQMLPLDVQLDLGKRFSKTDTVEIHDTFFVDKPQIIVINKKSSKVNSPKKATVYDKVKFTPELTLNNPVSNKGISDREEKTEEIVDSSKESSIQLIVDGKIVYSKNVNHSTGK